MFFLTFFAFFLQAGNFVFLENQKDIWSNDFDEVSQRDIDYEDLALPLNHSDKECKLILNSKNYTHILFIKPFRKMWALLKDDTITLSSKTFSKIKQMILENYELSENDGLTFVIQIQLSALSGEASEVVSVIFSENTSLIQEYNELIHAMQKTFNYSIVNKFINRLAQILFVVFLDNHNKNIDRFWDEIFFNKLEEVLKYVKIISDLKKKEYPNILQMCDLFLINKKKFFSESIFSQKDLSEMYQVITRNMMASKFEISEYLKKLHLPSDAPIPWEEHAVFIGHFLSLDENMFIVENDTHQVAEQKILCIYCAHFFLKNDFQKAYFFAEKMIHSNPTFNLDYYRIAMITAAYAGELKSCFHYIEQMLHSGQLTQIDRQFFSHLTAKFVRQNN